jgi:hypothetical protein
MDIGFIGLGNMGFHMARRLIEAGHTVIALDTRKEALDRIVALGGKAAASAKEVGDRAEVVMASLPTPDVVLAVATGKGGVIDGQRVRRFVDLSTTGSDMAQRIFELLKARDIVQIDAPVSGGVSGAEKGTVAVMASGPRADVEALEPALSVIGKFFYIGEQPGAGQTMKLCNNFLSAVGMAATAEAMVLGVKAGLDPERILEVIGSGAGNSRILELRGPMMARRVYTPPTATMHVLQKDSGIIAEFAAALGVSTPMLAAAAPLYDEAEAQGHAEEDVAAVHAVLADRAGL